MQLYEWKGAPLNVWHTPAVTGRYEVNGMRFRTTCINNQWDAVFDRWPDRAVGRDLGYQ